MDKIRVSFFLTETILLFATIFFTWTARDKSEATAAFCVFNMLTWVNAFILVLIKHPVMDFGVVTRLLICFAVASAFLYGATTASKKEGGSI